VAAGSDGWGQQRKALVDQAPENRAGRADGFLTNRVEVMTRRVLDAFHPTILLENPPQVARASLRLEECKWRI
jgi:hypothetical protein